MLAYAVSPYATAVITLTSSAVLHCGNLPCVCFIWPQLVSMWEQAHASSSQPPGFPAQPPSSAMAQAHAPSSALASDLHSQPLTNGLLAMRLGQEPATSHLLGPRVSVRTHALDLVD